MRRSILPILPLVVACYRYAPIEPAMVRPGTSVRARLSAAAAEPIAPLLGGTDARLLNGTVVENRLDTMIVEVPAVLRADVGTSTEVLHQRVSIPRAGLFELETRRLDRGRTAALAGAVTVLAAVVVVRSLRSDPGKEASPPGGGGNDLRAPFSVRIPYRGPQSWPPRNGP